MDKDLQALWFPNREEPRRRPEPVSGTWNVEKRKKTGNIVVTVALRHLGAYKVCQGTGRDADEALQALCMVLEEVYWSLERKALVMASLLDDEVSQDPSSVELPF